jgi:hypothetical protein
MFWDICIAVAASATQLITAYLGWRMTVNPIDPKDATQKRKRIIYEGLFLAAGFLGVVLVGLAAYRVPRERAHLAVVPEPTYLHKPNDEYPVPFLMVNMPLSFNVRYTNVGNGTAVNLGSRMHVFIEPDISTTSESDVHEQFEKMKVSQPLKGAVMLAKGADQFGSAKGPILSPEDYANLMFGRRVAYIVAELRYRDDIGAHYRHYCQALLPPQPGGHVIFATCENYNDEN